MTYELTGILGPRGPVVKCGISSESDKAAVAKAKARMEHEGWFGVILREWDDEEALFVDMRTEAGG